MLITFVLELKIIHAPLAQKFPGWFPTLTFANKLTAITTILAAKIF
jgi:hypothetical protein